MSEASFSIAIAGLASGIGTLYIGDNRSSATSVQNSARGRFDTVRIYNHELTTTEINADRTASPSCSLLHHLELTSSSATALAGSTETFTIKACANASCSSLYTDGVSGNLSASGSGMTVSYPNGAAFNTGASGSTAVKARVSPNGSVTVGLSGISPAAVTSPAVYCGLGTAATAGGSCNFTTVADGQPMVSGQRISLESFALPGQYIRHFSPLASLSALNGSSSLAARQDASFFVRPGLADSNCWSFESATQPGWYLRHYALRLRLDAYSASSPYPEDATFCKRPGLADNSKVSFESLNYAGYYIRNLGDLTVGIEAPSGGDFNARATFIPQPALLDVPAQMLARYRLEEPSWSGAAGELTDSAGHASGPFAGRAQGSPLPSAATAAPARAGNPGTCGYAQLPGPDAGGGSFVVTGLPLSTSAGARTSIAFWMRWTGGSSDVPIGFQHLNLGIWGGTFGFSTNSGDNFGVASSGLLNTWVHVVAVFNNGSIGGNKLYLNGVQQSLSQRIGSPDLNRSTVGSTLYLGAYGDRTTDRFEGQLDEVQVFQGELSAAEVSTLYNEVHACPSALDRLRIEHPSGAGVTCTPNTLTLRACVDAACTTPYTGGLSGTLTATGGTVNWPAGANFNIPAGSSTTTVAMHLTSVGSTLLGATGLSQTPTAGTTCNFGSPSCTFNATASGFLISVPHHVADTSRSVSVSAVRTDTNTGACTPAFANVSQVVNFSCQHVNPASGSRPVRLDGGSGAQVLNASGSTSAGCDGSTRAVTLNFNGSGVATPTLQYADVGEVRLNASHSGSGSSAGLSMAGSTTFVAQPWYLVLSVPGTTKVAGSPFTATVTGITSGSVAAPNFGKESPAQPLSFGWVRTRPSGTGAVNGSFSGGSVGSFTNGSASVSNLVWSEVGRGDLSVWFNSGSYLGTGWQTGGSTNLSTVTCAAEGGTCTVPAGMSAIVAFGTTTAWKALTNFSGSTACTVGAFGTDPAPGQTKTCFYLVTGGANTGVNGNVGAFRPHHLALSLVPGCGSFSYAGQGASATVLARNAQSQVTENYDGSANTSPNFARAVTLSEPTALGLGTMSGTAIAATGFFRGSATASPNYTFTSKTSGPGIWSLRATDSDGVSSAAAGGGVEGSVPLRSGRLRMSNAFGRANTALQVPLVAEYWNNQAWLHSSGDNCTGIALDASNVAVSNPRGATGAASTASTSVSMGAWSNGRGTLLLAAPSPAGSSLSVDLAINLGSTGTDQSCNASKPASVAANKAWLRSHNGFCGGSSASDRDPAARATFGIYTPESRRVVVVREF